MIHPLIDYPSTRKNIVNSSQDRMLRQKNSQPSILLPCVFVPPRFEVIEQNQIPGRVGAGVGWSRVGTLASPCGGYFNRGEILHGYSCSSRQYYNRFCCTSAAPANSW